jgi:hypothetical protein
MYLPFGAEPFVLSPAVKKCEGSNIQDYKPEQLGTLTKFSEFIGSRSSDRPACSTVPQPITVPGVPEWQCSIY